MKKVDQHTLTSDLLSEHEIYIQQLFTKGSDEINMGDNQENDKINKNKNILNNLVIKKDSN